MACSALYAMSTFLPTASLASLRGRGGATTRGASVYIAMTLCDETLEDRIQRKGLAAPAARAGAAHPPLHLTIPCCADSDRDSRWWQSPAWQLGV